MTRPLVRNWKDETQGMIPMIEGPELLEGGYPEPKSRNTEHRC